MWDPKLVDEVLRLREEYPRWGKDKLVILIKRKRSSGKVGVDLQSHPSQSGLELEEPGGVSYRAPSGVSFCQDKNIGTA
jgi:hypothetical protein